MWPWTPVHYFLLTLPRLVLGRWDLRALSPNIKRGLWAAYPQHLLCVLSYTNKRFRKEGKIWGGEGHCSTTIEGQSLFFNTFTQAPDKSPTQTTTIKKKSLFNTSTCLLSVLVYSTYTVHVFLSVSFKWKTNLVYFKNKILRYLSKIFSQFFNSLHTWGTTVNSLTSKMNKQTQ